MKPNSLFNSTFLILVFFLPFNLEAQEWDLEKEVDGVQIFTRFVEGAKLKELKIEFMVESRLGPLVNLICDEERFNDWVYRSTHFEKIEQTGDSEGIYYGTVDFPWPLDDRDYVIETKLIQNPDTKSVLIESTHICSAAKPACKNLVRIPEHHNRWELNPVSSEEIHVLYWLKSDPGGAIPTWLVNLAIDKGATATIKNLKTLLYSSKQDLRLAHIVEK